MVSLCVLSACPVAPVDGIGVFAVNKGSSESGTTTYVIICSAIVLSIIRRRPFLFWCPCPVKFGRPFNWGQQKRKISPLCVLRAFAVNTGFSEASFKYDILFLGGEISLDVNRPPTK